MTNQFENENDTYLVLINDEAQHSLWPSCIDVPRGWRVVHPDDSRQACLDYVNQHWTDMRPRSLVEAMAADAQPVSSSSGDTQDQSEMAASRPSMAMAPM
jgi:MbtH protein